MRLEDLTQEQIISAAKHVFRHGATDYELEHDAPIIMAVAWRYGLRIVTTKRTEFGYSTKVLQDDDTDYGEPAIWQELAPKLDFIRIESVEVMPGYVWGGQPVWSVLGALA